MKKIGISASLQEDIHSTFDKYDIVRVADNYVRSIANLGAVPVVLPVVEDDRIIEAQLQGLDGLILSGGNDVSPYLYNEEMLKGCGNALVARDIYELKLVKAALALKIPILGICRGCQILNVAMGGNLYQDLSYIDGVKIKHDNLTKQTFLSHKITIEKDSFLGRIYEEEIWINSFHHQAVKDLAEPFKVIAKSTDGVVEAFEGRSNDTFMLGVQWHPEMMAAKHDEQMLKLFKNFIEYKF